MPGDKPEDLYPEAAAELEALGHASTVSYVAEAARVVFQETGLLPHVNAGTLQQSQLTDLRRWSASQVPGSLLPCWLLIIACLLLSDHLSASG